MFSNRSKYYAAFIYIKGKTMRIQSLSIISCLQNFFMELSNYALTLQMITYNILNAYANLIREHNPNIYYLLDIIAFVAP